MILAIDCSTNRASLALVRDDGEVAEALAVESRRSRSGPFFGALGEMVSRLEAPLSRVIVGVGPGSYNGIRSSLAAGWGIALGRQARLVGVSSLLALDEGSYCAVGDARRGQYYFARVGGGAFEREPILCEPAELLAALEGEAGPIYAPGALEILPRAVIRTPDAVRLARVGATAAPSETMPEPIYLKPAYVNLPNR